MTLPTGTIIDERFEVIETLGMGGFGTVYKARQINFDRTVAVKVLNAEAIDAESTARLLREAQALSSMQHRNLPIFYGYGRWGDSPYLAIEYVEGKDLQFLVQDPNSLPSVHTTLDVFRQICDGLATAHSHGIVHRDLKCSNILLTDQSDGTKQVKIIDFGLARVLPESGLNAQQLTDMGQAIGTVYSMSPEQCIGQPADYRSDIYSVGCMLFQALTGEYAFSGESAVSIMFMHLKDNPPSIALKSGPQQLEKAFQEIISRCLQKEPANRYASVQDIGNELAAIGKQLKPSTKAHFAAARTPLSGQASTVPNLDQQPARSKKLLRHGALAAVLLAAAIAMYMLMSSHSIMCMVANTAFGAAQAFGIKTPVQGKFFQWCWHIAQHAEPSTEQQKLTNTLFDDAQTQAFDWSNFETKGEIVSEVVKRQLNERRLDSSKALYLGARRKLIHMIEDGRVPLEDGQRVRIVLYKMAEEVPQPLDAGMVSLDIADTYWNNKLYNKAEPWYAIAFDIGSKVPGSTIREVVARTSMALRALQAGNLDKAKTNILAGIDKIRHTTQPITAEINHLEFAVQVWMAAMDSSPKQEWTQGCNEILKALKDLAPHLVEPRDRAMIDAQIVALLRATTRLDASYEHLKKLQQEMTENDLWRIHRVRTRFEDQQFWTYFNAKEEHSKIADDVFASQRKSADPMQQFSLHLQLAHISERRGDWPDAINHVNQAIKISETHPHLLGVVDNAMRYEVLAKYLFAQNRQAEGLATLCKAKSNCSPEQKKAYELIAAGSTAHYQGNQTRAYNKFWHAANLTAPDNSLVSFPEFFYHHYLAAAEATGKGTRADIEGLRLRVDTRRLQRGELID